MAPPLRIALLADGKSDRALLRVIVWTLRTIRPSLVLAEPGFETREPTADLSEEIQRACELFEPHVIFVHRDAEGTSLESRRKEIPDLRASTPKMVRVVPVRMTEAWLLGDEKAIREAVGRPSGTRKLDMPRLNDLERTPSPKTVLRDILTEAAEVQGRRRKELRRNLGWIVQRVAELTHSYAPLRVLPALTAFETDCRGILQAMQPEIGSRSEP